MSAAFPLVFERQLAHHDEDVAAALHETFLEIDALVPPPPTPSAHSSQVKPWGLYTGSTGVVAYINHDTLWVANAGDSRAVLSRNGEVLRMYESILSAEGELSSCHLKDSFLILPGPMTTWQLTTQRRIGSRVRAPRLSTVE